ncbi:MAG: hypothetical protein LJE96_21285 [Deltaproteobacteria bacterium]|nr:hypothetical protein [Deltaproteobacteria bacterium]
MQEKAPIHISDGKTYGKVQGSFRGRWWNYYERGLSYADGRFFEEAARDFRTAIQKREKDQRMARTYGMHFVDYFAHRELGIVYFRMGDLEEAKKELTLSLNQFSSAKAGFYLDRVRKGLIEKTGRDIAPPTLRLDIEKDEVWTREDPVLISGTAEDENFVSEVTIQGAPLYLGGSKSQVSFKEDLALDQGPHTIEVVAQNLPGKTSRRHVLIHVDREGPLIVLEDVYTDPNGPGGLATIKGSAYDEAGITHLTLNGAQIPTKGRREVSFSKKLPTHLPGVDLVAVDRLGNRTSAYIELNAPSTRRKPLMVACRDIDGSGLLMAGLFGPKDTRPPEISIKGWTDSQTVYLEKIYLDGHVVDENSLERVTLNDKPILIRKGKRIFFNHIVKLKEGQNSLTIEAVDDAGNKASKKIMVTRIVPKPLQLAERLSLAVFPFAQQGTALEAGLSFQDNLIGALVEQGRFRVVERDRLDLILEEQKLSRTKLADKKTALRLGRLIAAQTILSGNILETSTGIEIVGRVIDTETSEILAVEDVYDEIKQHQALKTLAKGMAIKVHRRFPLVSGTVIKQEGNTILTDMGKGKIDLQRRLVVYEEESIKHPLNGRPLGMDCHIRGHARVIQVMPEMSKAEMVERSSCALIKPLDKVISQ